MSLKVGVYEMNEQLLPILHGAPLRVDAESGFTMVKGIRAVELIEVWKTIGNARPARVKIGISTWSLRLDSRKNEGDFT